MAEVLFLILFAAAMAGVFVFLYNQGYMVSKSIHAVTFIGSAKGNSAKFTACSGYIKRVITFKEDGLYTFVLDAELHRGDMSVELLDSSKQVILQLNHSCQKAAVSAEKKRKYYLVIHFSAATGSYSLIRERSGII